MNVNGRPYRTIWVAAEDRVRIIDQRWLPHQWIEEDLCCTEDVVRAIADMHVRGAGLIGATGGFGMWLAAREALAASGTNGFLDRLDDYAKRLATARPTAVNLSWAVNRQLSAIRAAGSPEEAVTVALKVATDIADEDADCCRQIGLHGLEIVRQIAASKPPGEPVHILTHCNAGWLAFVDFGSATAPIYAAHDAGIAVHVWVDETRPRCQGSKLTAWELGSHGVPHTLVADNTGGHLMQHGMVDLVIVGSDRTTRTGDVANKIGTYLKALAAKDNGVPFYVALPSSTFDWSLRDGIREIPVERRGDDEVLCANGWNDNRPAEVRLAPVGTTAANYAFDVTPARLVTGLITERGLCEASEQGILRLFPERA